MWKVGEVFAIMMYPNVQRELLAGEAPHWRWKSIEKAMKKQ